MKQPRLFVIGDVHGCREQLEELLAKIDPKITHPDDKIVLLGDYVDRGPDSKGVVDLLLKRHEKNPFRHIFLRGNHEEMLLNSTSSLHHWLINGGNETLQSYGYDPVKHSHPLACIPNRHMQFYRLDTQLYYKRNRTFCVHAGISPHQPWENQSPETMLWERRWVGYDGGYVDDLFVVYGHTPKSSIVQKSNQLGIDTACVFGGSLTCAVIDDISGNVDEIYKVSNKEVIDF